MIVFDTNNDLVDITIRLQQTSRMNGILAAAYNAAKFGGGGGNVFGVFQLVDLNGTLIHFAEKSWIRRAPDINYNNSPQPREWGFSALLAQRFDGGH